MVARLRKRRVFKCHATPPRAEGTLSQYAAPSGLNKGIHFTPGAYASRLPILGVFGTQKHPEDMYRELLQSEK